MIFLTLDIVRFLVPTAPKPFKMISTNQDVQPEIESIVVLKHRRYFIKIVHIFWRFNRIHISDLRRDLHSTLECKQIHFGFFYIPQFLHVSLSNTAPGAQINI